MLFGLLELGRTERNSSGDRGDSLKNARIAMYLVSRDLMNAGLGFHKEGALVPNGFISEKLDVLADSDPGRDLLTSINLGNDVNLNSIGGNVKTDTISFAYRDLTFNNGAPIVGIDETSADPNAITIKTNAGQTAQVNVSDVFLAETNSAQVMLVVTSKDDANNTITFANNDPLKINQVKTGGVNTYANSLLRKCDAVILTGCTTYNIASNIGIRLKRVRLFKYMVDPTGTLVRIVYGGNTGAPSTIADQIQKQPLISGVKNLQFEYVLEDGKVTSDPIAGLDGIRANADDKPTDANLIRQVSVNLTIVAETKDSRTGVRENISLKSTFSSRNVKYDDR
jgi:hypothetical protein